MSGISNTNNPVLEYAQRLRHQEQYRVQAPLDEISGYETDGKDVVIQRLTRGIQGGQQWQEAVQKGTSDTFDIVYGEKPDLTRPRLNTLGYLAAMDTNRDGKLNRDEFVGGFDLAKQNPELVQQLMAAVDTVDGKVDSKNSEPAVSLADAMPLVGFYDSGASGNSSEPEGQPGQLDMTISPQDRADAKAMIKSFAENNQFNQFAQMLEKTYRLFYQSE